MSAVLLVGAACDFGPAASLGADGGALVSQDGRFELDVPPGALDSPVELNIRASTCRGVASGGPCYAVEPVGTTFLRPVRVSYELGGSEVAARTDEFAVAVMRDGGWVWLPDRRVDLEDETVMGTTLYLSTFALMAVPTGE